MGIGCDFVEYIAEYCWRVCSNTLYSFHIALYSLINLLFVTNFVYFLVDTLFKVSYLILPYSGHISSHLSSLRHLRG